MQKYIRPNRDDVIRWYIQITMVVLWVASGHISRFVVDVADIEHGPTRWLIRFVTFAIPIIVLVVMSERDPSAEETVDERL